jgi:hypothetical protein
MNGLMQRLEHNVCRSDDFEPSDLVRSVEQHYFKNKCATQRKLHACSFAGYIKNIFFIILFFAFASCDSKKQTDKQVFYYNETTGVATLDPAFARNQSIMWVVHQLYNTLVEIDSNLHMAPSLAKSWEISDDRLLILFICGAMCIFKTMQCFLGARAAGLLHRMWFLACNALQTNAPQAAVHGYLITGLTV